MEFFRIFYGIIPSNPLPYWGGVRQKRNHGKLLLAELRPEASKNSRLFELALVLVRFDHVASFIVNANHSVDVSGCDASRSPIAVLALARTAADRRAAHRKSDRRRDESLRGRTS